MRYGVDRAEVLRYLGYAGQTIEPELYDRIDALVDRAERELSPKGVAKRFSVEVRGEGTRGTGALPYVEVQGTALVLEGFDIVRHLEGACACVLLACTLGAKSEQELSRLKAVNPLDALIYDAACSALIERVADAAEAEVVAEAAADGLQANWRFSPGYGDLPLSVQTRFVSVLRAFETIGLTVTDTDLLVPTKSVTAIVGLFDGPVADAEPRTCSMCRMKDFCTLRTTGRTCNG